MKTASEEKNQSQQLATDRLLDEAETDDYIKKSELPKRIKIRFRKRDKQTEDPEKELNNLLFNKMDEFEKKFDLDLKNQETTSDTPLKDRLETI